MNGFLLASDLYVEITDQILELLIIPTMIAGLLAGLVLLINLFARKWLTAGQMGLLWALVLIRLALPYGYAPESSYSLTNLFVEFMEESTPAEPPRDAYAPEPWPMIDTNATTMADVPPMHQIQFPEPKPPEVSFTETLLDYLISFLEWFLRILPPFWFIGALFILTRMLVTHWQFTRKINRLPISTDLRLLRLWNTCCQQVYFRRSVPVIVTDDISQPSVMGALHPKLLLPTDLAELSDSQLELIMFHELAHLKRRDLWVNWFLFGLKLFHWWNPLYWLAATRYSSLREQSRDAMVLRWREQQDHDTNSDPSREFSELLLTLAQRDPGSRWRISLPVSLLGFLKSPFRKRSLANRLKALRSATVKVHPLHTTAVIIVITLCAATGLADVNDSTVQQQQQGGYERQPNWSAELPLPEPVSNTTFEPLYTQKIKVDQVIEKISEERSISKEQSRQYLLGHIDFLLKIKNNKYWPVGKSAEQAYAKYDKQNRLVVYASSFLHEELGQQLRAWKQSGLGQISLETRFAELSADIVARSNFTWSALEADVAPESRTQFESLTDSNEPLVQASAIVEEFIPVRVAVLTKAQETHFIRMAQSDERSNLLYAPKVTVFNGQRASVSDIVQRPFVIGLQKNENAELKPKIKVIDDGRNLTFRTVISDEGSEVNLRGLIELSQIVDVNLYTTQIAGKERTIQIPRVIRRSITVTSSLKDEQTLLICIPPAFQQKLFQYVMLKVRILDEPK
ncbi:M56 family metallopeptidase [Gimesia chilikensis]|uniref:Regulatory protein BlaR1 n=1 Tax=Gimesia chilikensis TaxID=2605989 RepID=A0A517PWL9_9PLAN|nr:M56 family metallopeptidase [Gimesia chilikensis]QDT23778.1 Regulatory protein BlaR1 [Gimesia chilikensis]